ncbi:MAG: EAL domain-containing protein [Steroidobacteraceae bacterium]
MTGSYETWTVALSVLVAVAVSYAALNVSARIARARGLAARMWLAGGALTMGVGIWAMHFIGMMAFRLPVPLAYNLFITLLSLALTVAASAYALRIASAPALPPAKVLQSGVILGLGISAMHYVGMDAITIEPGVRYEPRLFAASVMLAIAASVMSLWLAFRLRQGRGWRLHAARVAAGIVLGSAISGMHYIGMAATVFAPGAFCVGGVVLDQGWLAITVALVALGLIAITSGLILVDMHMASRAHQHAAQLERANQKLSHAATHDALTGLPNRTLLGDRLQQAVAQAQRQNSQFALAVIDLDRFKSINDSLGHLAGDELLRELAARLPPQLRATDTLARMGGDEFVALLTGAGDRAEVLRILRQLQQEISRPMRVVGVEIQVSSSIGVALYPADGHEGPTLLRHADAAMYGAKHAGRDNLQFFTAGMAGFARDRQELESALREALAGQQLLLHFQPLLDIGTGRVERLEALLRWQHPTRGLLLPADFLPLAGDAGLMRGIGAWALLEACRQLRAWHLAGHDELCIAVNLSAEQLNQPDLLAQVQAVLGETQVDARFVELEFSEAALMHDVEHSAKRLGQLVKLGLRVTLDDFGTGFSSISFLRRLPLHGLKIDRSFIQGMEAGGEDADIVSGMVSLAHCLHLQVTAEGVETAGQLQLLRTLGCDRYQGFLYRAPLPAAQCGDFLKPPSTTQRLRVLGKLARARLLGGQPLPG